MKYDILIVEDDPDLARNWKRFLEREGYQPDVAADGKAGWDCWQSKPYDAILLDLKMPKLSGSDLLSKIREQQPWTPVVIISGEGTERDKLRAINEHAFAYLEKKDVTIDHILAALKRALEARHLPLRCLEALVANAADPDQPLIAVGNKEYSPRQLYDEARRGVGFGRTYLDQLAETVIEMSRLLEPEKRSDDKSASDDGLGFVAGGVIE